MMTTKLALRITLPGETLYLQDNGNMCEEIKWYAESKLHSLVGVAKALGRFMNTAVFEIVISVDSDD